MPDPAGPPAIAGSVGDRTISSSRGAGRTRARTKALRRAWAAPERPSRWALALFWASTAFTAFAVALLIASFLG